MSGNYSGEIGCLLWRNKKSQPQKTRNTKRESSNSISRSAVEVAEYLARWDERRDFNSYYTMAAPTQLQQQTGLVRAVRRWDLVALVINCIIGTGIFGLPSQAYKLTGAYSLFAFIACALVAVTVAITYAEVAGRFPGTGGAYLYVTEAFGPLICFEV